MRQRINNKDFETIHEIILSDIILKYRDAKTFSEKTMALGYHDGHECFKCGFKFAPSKSNGKRFHSIRSHIIWNHIMDESERERIINLKKQIWIDNPELIEEYRNREIQRYIDNPELRKEMSDIKKKQYENNPELLDRVSKGHKKFFIENPNAAKEHSERLKKKFAENPDLLVEMKTRIQKFHTENPDFAKEMGKKLNKDTLIIQN